VKVVFQIALGIIAAIGGFVDIGDLVFSIQAGAIFGYGLLWAVVVGVIGIIGLLRRGGDRGGADAIRGLLLFVGRRRGALDAEG
jgi:hypothetical protein